MAYEMPLAGGIQRISSKSPRGQPLRGSENTARGCAVRRINPWKNRATQLLAVMLVQESSFNAMENDDETSLVAISVRRR